MTRLKKLLVAGLMVIVTGCASIGSALLNMTRSIFSWVRASANSYYEENTHDGAVYKDGDIVTVKNIPSKAKKDVDTVYIPRTALTTSFAGTSTTAAETIVEIKNPYGASLTDTSKAFSEEGHILDAGQLALGVDNTANGGENHAGEYALTPSQTGVYTVQYAVKNEDEDVWTVSEVYEIFVTADSYDIQFQANDPIVMPDKIDTSTNAETTVKIKLPVMYNKDGTLIEKFVLGQAGTSEYYVAEYVTLNNVYLSDENLPLEYTQAIEEANKYNRYEEYSTYKITRTTTLDSDVEYGLLVEVSKSGNLQTNSYLKTPENMLVLNTEKFENDSDYYTRAAYTFEAIAGMNTVTYKLYKSDFKPGSTPDALVSYTIDGSSTYNSKVDLGISTSTTIKNSDVSFNEKCYLPKVSAVDKNANKNTVNAYYGYKVAYVDTSGSKDVYHYGEDYVTMGVDEKGVYFIPRYLENDGVPASSDSAIYNISYTATDFYGNKDKNVEDYDYDVTVRDNTSPSLYFVKSYDLKLDDKNHADKTDVDMNDYSYAIPSKYVIKEGDASNWTKIAVPAVFTSDNYNTFDQLKITRILSSENGFIGKSKNHEIKIQDIDGSTSTTDAGIITFEDHTATNYYVSGNKFYNNEHVELAKNSSALKQAKTSTVAYINIDPSLFGEGEYTIQYSVQDARYSNNSGKTFTFTLVKDTAEKVDSTAPTVKFGTSTISNVSYDQEISIKAPEIKDEVDTRLLKKYFVVAGANRLEITPDENNNLVFNTKDEITTDTSIYEAAVASDDKSFKVYAVAVDDFGSVANWETFDFNPTNNIGVDSYEISVKYVEDDLAPTIVGKGTVKEGTEITENNANKQFTTINAHGIKFYDDTNSAYVTVKVLNSKGIATTYEELPGSYVKKVAATNISAYIADSNDKTRYDEYVYEYNFAGIKFLANDADNYTIVYTITDGGNNTTTYAYVIRATLDGQAPSISVLGTTHSVELGKILDLHDIEINDIKTPKDKLKIESVVELAGKGNRDSYFNAANKTFIAREEGVYTLTLTAIDEADNKTTKTITINVADSTKPVLNKDKVENDVEYIREDQLVKEENSTKVKEYPTITLPVLTATDVYPDEQNKELFRGVLGATGTLTITTPSDKVYTINFDQDKPEGDNPLNLVRKPQVEGSSIYNFYFTPTERGKYVCSYVAEDKSGNKSNAVKIEYNIGDTEVPAIFLTGKLQKMLNKGFVVDGDALVINTEARVLNSENYKSQDLYVSDNFGFKKETVYADENKTEVDYEYVKVTVSVTNSNNNTIKSETDGNNVIYKFDTKGTYTITFTVTDSVGKVGTLTKSFKVTKEEASSTDATQIIGTVLIIVSIVILAGVVIYFVRGTKLLPKKNKKAKNKKD